MPGDPGGIRHGTPSQEASPDILEAPQNFGESGGGGTMVLHSRENVG